jgi:group I intron endonuclease
MKHLIYLSTNLINGKQYIGDHSTNNINDSYLGSGVLIKKSIKKYGRQNFRKEIIKIFETKREAFDAQEKYILKYNTLTPNGYNISIKGGHQEKKSLSPETLEKIRLSLAGKKLNLTEEQRKRRREIQRGKKHSEETKNKIRLKNLGKKVSEGSKEKNRQHHLGKKLSAKSKEKISQSLIGNTRTLGHKNSKEQNEKISQSLMGKNKGRKMSEEFKLKIKKSWEKRRKNFLL